MLKIGDATAALERFAPLPLQEEYDNSGLIYGDPKKELKGVTVSLDLTVSVVEEAAENGSNLIVTHHPVVFRPIRSLDLCRPEHVALTNAIKRDIAVYAAHTNVDKAPGGLSETVLGLLGARVPEQGASLPKFGYFEKPVALKELYGRVKKALGDERAAYVGDPGKLVSKVALITGAGGDEESLRTAVDAGADVFLSGEFKYHVIRFAKDADYAIISFGHFESEKFFTRLAAKVLSESGISPVRESACEENPFTTEGRS